MNSLYNIKKNLRKVVDTYYLNTALKYSTLVGLSSCNMIGCNNSDSDCTTPRRTSPSRNITLPSRGNARTPVTPIDNQTPYNPNSPYENNTGSSGNTYVQRVDGNPLILKLERDDRTTGVGSIGSTGTNHSEDISKEYTMKDIYNKN